MIAIELRAVVAATCMALAQSAGLAFADPPTQTIKVRIIGENGQRAARVRIVDKAGKEHAPEDAAIRKLKSGESYFYADGAFEVTVPNGKTSFHFSGGIEVSPTETTVDATSNKRLEVIMRPWIDLAEQGWYSGDSHVHLHTGGPIEVTLADALVAARAEGLNYVNLCVSNNVGDDIRDADLITGKPHAISTDKHLLVFGEEMRSMIYGHMQFFGIKKLVEPQYTGFDNTPNHLDFPANHRMAAEAVRQGGFVTYGHPMFAGQPFPFGDDLTTPNAAARELPVDAILNVVQGVDLMCYNSDEDLSGELWYRLLNCGLKLSACVGTDALLDRSTDPMGGCRMYVKVDGPLTMQSWLDGLSNGKTFVTNGPIPQLNVNGVGIGGTCKVAPGPVRVTASVKSHVPFEQVEVIVNGKVAAEKTVAVGKRQPGGAPTVEFEVDIPIKRSAWIALRVRGPDDPSVIDGPVWAHTSPVYVQVDRQPIRSPDDAQYFVDWIGQLLRVVAARNRYATADDRVQVEALFRKAQDLYRQQAK